MRVFLTGPEDASVDGGDRWREYVTTYVMRLPTEWVPPGPVDEDGERAAPSPFLKRWAPSFLMGANGADRLFFFFRRAERDVRGMAVRSWSTTRCPCGFNALRTSSYTRRGRRISYGGLGGEPVPGKRACVRPRSAEKPVWQNATHDGAGGVLYMRHAGAFSCLLLDDISVVVDFPCINCVESSYRRVFRLGNMPFHSQSGASRHEDLLQ
jgi:hypothetical protein